jgi:hypothetical protein
MKNILYNLRMKLLKKIPSTSLILIFALLLNQCENKERFYRPDLPEQMCAIGIIDIDDTSIYDVCLHMLDTLSSSRNLFFEKSFQPEYPDDVNNPIKEFTFRIANSDEDIYVYHNDQPARDLNIKIPVDLEFESGRKYFFSANEKETASISAECTVPELPPIMSLISFKPGFVILDKPKNGCYYKAETGRYHDGISEYTRRTAEIEFSFPNDNRDSYYAILLTGSFSDTNWEWGPGSGSNYINFNVLEANPEGFFFPLHGRITIQHYCQEFTPYSFGVNCRYDTLNAYFIEGNKIPGVNCTIKFSTYWDNIQFSPSFIKCFRIRLLSIPKEAYLFYKSLYTYKVQADDPFSELVNINGNVVGGNGIIALCRSRELLVYTGQKGGMYDPFF